MVRGTEFCTSEDSATYHAREPAARNDNVVNDFSGNTVVTLQGQLVDTHARQPGASYSEIIRCTNV